LTTFFRAHRQHLSAESGAMGGQDIFAQIKATFEHLLHRCIFLQTPSIVNDGRTSSATTALSSCEIEFALRARDHDFAAHNLTLEMRVGIVFVPPSRRASATFLRRWSILN
jgi:hypothetical protein